MLVLVQLKGNFWNRPTPLLLGCLLFIKPFFLFQNQGTALDPIVKAQERIIRNITNSEFLAHTSPLFKDLDLLKLPDLTDQETLKLIFHYEHHHLPESLLSDKIKKCHDYHLHAILVKRIISI